MSGVTKHIFNQEVRDILSMWDCEIKTIEPLLPKEYSSGDIITLLKEFYPHEWHSVEIKYVYYQTKDRYIKRKFGKSRYHMKAPEVLLMDASRCKKVRFNKLCKRVESKQKIISKCFGLYLSFKRHNY